jgi:hypothetical protein
VTARLLLGDAERRLLRVGIRRVLEQRIDELDALQIEERAIERRALADLLTLAELLEGGDVVVELLPSFVGGGV